MKTIFRSALLFAAVLALSLHAANNNDPKKERTFLALVVAEQPARGSTQAIGNAAPGACLVLDGG
jgi:hypothetical protein